MKWAFWAVGAIALIWAVDVHEAANSVLHQIAGLLMAIFGMLAFGFGAVIHHMRRPPPGGTREGASR